MFRNLKGDWFLLLGDFARISRGNQVLINDLKEPKDSELEKVEELKKLGVEFLFGEHPEDLLDSN